MILFSSRRFLNILKGTPSPPFISSHKFVCVQKSSKIQKVAKQL
nr:MAG TPA: hypothetical protein [Caudoviricetes sp.]